MEKNVIALIEEHIRTVERAGQTLSQEVATAVRWIVNAFESGNKILIAGNGGSAADAQHIAAEFVGRFRMERRSLPAIALTTDTSILTALGNDYGFHSVFARQLEGLLREGDIFLAISTSGNSRNIVEAVEICRKNACKVIGFLGNGGGELGGIVDLSIVVPSSQTPRIQEVHITLGHIVCELVESALCRSGAESPHLRTETDRSAAHPAAVSVPE